MKREAVTLIDDLKHDTAERLDPIALRRAGSATPDTSALVNRTVQPATSSPKRTLGERIKDILTKAMDGDHDFNNYFGF